MKAVHTLGLALFGAATLAASASAQSGFAGDLDSGYWFYPNYRYSYYAPGQWAPTFQYYGSSPPLISGGALLPTLVPAGLFAQPLGYGYDPGALSQRGLWRLPRAAGLWGPAGYLITPAAGVPMSPDAIGRSVSAARDKGRLLLRWTGRAEGVRKVEYEFRDVFNTPMETAASGEAPFQVRADVPDTKWVVVTVLWQGGARASVRAALADLEKRADAAERKAASGVDGPAAR